MGLRVPTLLGWGPFGMYPQGVLDEDHVSTFPDKARGGRPFRRTFPLSTDTLDG